jgi:Mg2+ and Co2+ transporter CorA
MHPMNLKSKRTYHRWLAPLIVVVSALAMLAVSALLR